mgnify:CR=1 FL=1
MTETLSNWFEVIKNCSVSNTYKMGRVKSYFKEDLSDKLVLGGEIYTNLPNDLK